MWQVGTPDELEIPMRLLANRAGIRTYLVDYRLAPEAKWPAQLEENEFVVRWLFKNAEDQDVDPSKVRLLAPSIRECSNYYRFRQG